MIKYDVPLDLEQNENMKDLVRKIEPNSTVLEFGPSAGRLTQYMKDELNCKVYIVEIDQAAFEKCKQFAYDGVCDDIETYSWENMVDGVHFDYVIFADVLEHLRDPEKVINVVKKYIDENSKILVSVPNITHNAVVLQLLNQRFDYQPTGLLDNTHIHFFTKETAREMFERVGYHMMSCEGTFAEPYNTELHMNFEGLPKSVIDYLSSRDYGNLYQIIYEFTLNDQFESTNEIVNQKSREYLAKVFYDYDGNGFKEEDSEYITIDLSNPNIHISLKPENSYVHSLALCPLDNYWSLSSIDSISINEEDIEVRYQLDNFTIETENHEYVINTQKYIFDIKQDINQVDICYHCKKILIDEVYEYCLKDLLTIHYEKDMLKIETEKKIDSLNKQYEKLDVNHLQIENSYIQLHEKHLIENLNKRQNLYAVMNEHKLLKMFGKKKMPKVDIKQYNYYAKEPLLYESGYCIFSHSDAVSEVIKSDYVILNFTHKSLSNDYYDEISKHVFEGLVIYSDCVLNHHHFYKTDFSLDYVYNNNCEFDVMMIQSELLKFVMTQYDITQIHNSREMMILLTKYTTDIHHISKIMYSTELNEETQINNNLFNDVLRYKYLNHAVYQNSQIQYDYLDGQPKVSIIIPTKDGLDMLSNCVESIVQKSTYRNYEIIILNNNSEKEETFEWFKEVTQKYSQVKVINALFEFNWSKLNNYGIKHASGDVYIFLNNDTLVESPDWMESLATQALRDDVGVVGSLLLYEDGTVQHSGVVIGMTDFADHIYKSEKPDYVSHIFASPSQKRNVLAVTGACMAISKNTIQKIGQFNDEFIICGSDVEICLRAYKQGLINVYEPKSVLYHLESKSRDSYIPEIDFVLSAQHYEPFRSQGDPYFNKNLDYKGTTPRERK